MQFGKRCVTYKNSILYYNGLFISETSAKTTSAQWRTDTSKLYRVWRKCNLYHDNGKVYLAMASSSLCYSLLDSNGISEINAKAFSHTNVKHL